MKISNFKIMLLLVLGAFTLTLPNNVRAADEMDWFNTNVRAGTIKSSQETDFNDIIKARNDIIAEIKKNETNFKEYKEQMSDGIVMDSVIGGVSLKDAFIGGVLDIGQGILDWDEENAYLQEQPANLIISAYTKAIELEKAEKNPDLKDIADYQNHIDAAQKFKLLIKELVPLKKDLRNMPDPNSIKGETYVYTDPNGGKVLFEKNGDTISAIAGVMIGCLPMAVKLAEVQSCIFCPLFSTIFNASQTVSTNSFNMLGRSMADVMLIGFALFVAFSVMKMVSGFTKQDGPKFITGLLSQTFKVLFAYILLVKSGEIYEYVIAPVLSAGLEFGMSLLFEEGHKYISCKSSTGNVSNGILPYYLYTKLDCFIRAVQAEISVPQTIGSTLMCVARNASTTEILSVSLWDFSMMFQGLIIFVFAWLISLAFAFYLIDATVRLGIVGALMPFLIACWPFKITSSYTSKGWEMFMNSFFTFVMMGLVISINVQLMGQALTGSKGGFDEIKAALNANSVQVLQDLLDIGFSGFLILIACCLFGFKLTGQATELANTMAGGGGTSIGSGIATLAASGAKATAGAAINTGTGAVSTISNATGATAGLNKMKDKAYNGLVRSASKLFGAGKNSGAAGGGKSAPAKPQAGQPTGAAPTPNTQQTQKAQEAKPRNNGNEGEERKIDGGSSTSAHSGSNAPGGGGNAPTGGETQANTPAGGNAPIPKTEDFVKAEQMLGSVAAKGGDTRAQKHQKNLIERDRQSNIAIQARGDAMKQHSESEVAANQANSLRSQSEQAPAEQKKDLLNQADAKDKEAKGLNAKAAENESRAHAAEKVQERLGRELNETLKQTAELCAKNRVEEKLK